MLYVLDELFCSTVVSVPSSRLHTFISQNDASHVGTFLLLWKIWMMCSDGEMILSLRVKTDGVTNWEQRICIYRLNSFDYCSTGTT